MSAFINNGIAIFADDPNLPKDKAASRRTIFLGSFRAFSRVFIASSESTPIFPNALAVSTLIEAFFDKGSLINALIARLILL